MGLIVRWLPWVVIAGLVLLYAGLRVLDASVIGTVLTLAGALLVLSASVVSALRWLRAEDDARDVARLFALGYLGCALAVVGFVLASEPGLGWLGVEFDEPATGRRFRRAALVAASVLLAVSLLPTLAARWSLGSGLEGDAARARVEGRRVSETATNALSVALAGAFLMFAGYLASVHDQTFDASYFKTSTPGTAVQEIVSGIETGVEAVLFFPEVNEVKDEVRDYFSALARATGNLSVEEVDRLSQPNRAEALDVRSDGVIVLTAGDRREEIGLPTEIRAARARLRTFDSEAQEALLGLTRERRTAYLTAGHGELSDPASDASFAGAVPGGDGPPLAVLREILRALNYESADLGVQDGLGDRIPDDAAMVLIIGPRRPFLEEELRAVDEYLERGGAVLLALEPESRFELGPLADRLGIEYNAEPLTDDRRFVRQRGGLADRRLIVTDQFSSHPAVTTAGRQGVGSGILLLGAGHITRPGGESAGGARTRFVMGALPSTFADLNDNFTFDEDTERRGGYELAAAIEGAGTPDQGFRALAYADAEMFSDAVLVSLGLNAMVVADGVRWLGGEEAFAGDVTTEEDVPIVHTQSEDVAWFYSIILGAPLVVLGAGLINVFAWRRRRRQRRTP